MGYKLLSSAAVLSAILLNCGAVTGKPSREIRKTFVLNSDGRVFIETYKGSIAVEPWDNPEVDVVAKIESDQWDLDAEEKVQDTEILFDASPNSVRMKTDYGKVRSGSSSFFGLFGRKDGSLPSVHYAIKMPKTARLRIKDHKSDSKISDLRSSIDLNTHKGTVTINGLDGSLDLKTHKGTVIIKELDGSLDLETYKGDARIQFARLSGDSRFETYKGRLAIQLPKDAGFELDAHLGRKGNLDSDFEIETTWKRRRHGDRSYRGTINRGGPVLRISTDKGDIRLLRE